MNDACKYGEEQLVSLLYEDGDPDELLELRAHLAKCAGCRAELEELGSMKEMLSAWPNAVNAPRMVYVHQQAGFLTRLRRWASELGELHVGALLRPAAATAAVVLVLTISISLLDVRVAPDGRLQVGFGAPVADPAGDPAAQATAAISREEFQEGLAEAVSYLEDLYQQRNDEERGLLVSLIDERMREQGYMMSDQLQAAVDSSLIDMQRQHQNDLGLVFSAIDEWGVVTGTELQRMNNILASLIQQAPGEEE